MSSTTFQNGVTLTDDDWFNDVDFLVYDLFGDSTTTASAASRLAPSFNNLTVAGTLSVSARATLAALTVAGTLSVSAQATVAGLTVAGVLSVSAKSTFAAVDIAGVLSATSVAGAVVATEAQMEAGTSSSVIVTPGMVKFDRGVAKAAVRFDGSATSVTAAAGSYNIASITDKGTGNYNVLLTSAFSAGSFPIPLVGTNLFNHRLVSVSAAGAEIITLDLSGTAADASIVTMVFFGDQ